VSDNEVIGPYTIYPEQSAVIVLVEDGRAREIVMRSCDPISAVGALLTAGSDLARQVADLVAAQLIEKEEPIPLPSVVQ
jgi:hypothetical protein